MLSPTGHQVDVVDVQEVRGELQLSRIVVDFEACQVYFVISILNNLGVLAYFKVLGRHSLILEVLQLHLRSYILTCNHVSTNSLLCSHLTSVVFAPGIQGTVHKLYNGELIGRVHFHYLVVLWVFFFQRFDVFV